MGTTDRRGCLVSKHIENLKLGTENQLFELRDGMAGRAVTGCANPSLSRISSYVLRDVFDYSCLNYKVRGFILITQILGG